MKLFRSDNETENSDLEAKVIRDKNKVVVISTNSSIQSEICSILKMHNIGKVVSKKQYINEFREDETTRDAGWYIVDIESEKDLSIINDIIVMGIPNDVMYVLIGDTDSITFSSELLKFGARYLYKNTQLGSVADIILNSKGKSVDRISLNVSILGCKGGCGNTTIASGLFSSIDKFISAPVLYIQGGSGSRDLDLISSENLGITIQEAKIQKTSSTKSVKIDSEVVRFDYDNPVYQQYNINLFDHNISRASPEELEIVFNRTNVFVLIVGNNFSSFRTAKKIIDEYKKFELRSKSRPKRIIICVNEYTVRTSRDKFSREDIEDFLERKVDMYLPHINSDKRAKEFNEELNTLNSLIFAKEIKDKESRKGLFSWFKILSKS
ncbi:hypothetical protein NWJ10_001689 [Salmonella enterica]|uniref:hypothetical protein n=1 Tax=Enterobacteriaceae TaxID=543 RepID=UPI000D56D5B4|nr:MULTISPECIES: hypothetical protein [Enterobacteriaceae]EAA5616316.1 hypothetical protein [Salmonella enterica subsp. enterica serovar Bredeney]EAO6765240.1 hypothetical protein [Salmonella enterica]EBU7716620.1 hypothetical protein [Salmonella enterica subsp. enterica serovar Thompson]ECB3311018.1 hypothetical protein [Salmonella enterica subsp. enterica serovar Mikawasima]ECU9703346.1 hypothetical protein [Salmonella enterica subsp. enterica serovar Panama]EDE1986733.1 hypothetical protei